MSNKEHNLNEEAELLTKQIKFLMSETQKEKLERLADKSGLTKADYMRNRILGYKISSKADYVALGQLRQSMGHAKHLFNEMNEAGLMTPELSAEFSETLRAVRAAAEAIVRGVDGNDS